MSYMDNERMEQVVDCVGSFYQAIQEAGGSVTGRCSAMDATLREFIANVAAPNHIRFVFCSPKKAR